MPQKTTEVHRYFVSYVYSIKGIPSALGYGNATWDWDRQIERGSDLDWFVNDVKSKNPTWESVTVMFFTKLPL